MANELSTHGIIVSYAVETTAGTKPTTGFVTIPNITNIPDFNPEPATLEVTDLSDTEYKRYIPGLKDIGGAIAFTANFTKAFATAWDTCVTAAEAAAGSDKACWWKITVPNYGAFEFAGMPSALGLPAIGVDEVFSGDVYVTPNQIDSWTIA